MRSYAEYGDITALVQTIALVAPILDAHGSGDASRQAKSCIVTVRKSVNLITKFAGPMQDIAVYAAYLLTVMMKHSSHEFAMANLVPLILDVIYKAAPRIMGPLITATTGVCPVMSRVSKDMRDVYNFGAAISSRQDGGAMLEAFIKRKTAAARVALLPTLYGKIGRVGCHNLKCRNVSCASEDELKLSTCPKGCKTSFCSRVCMFMDVGHSMACLGMRDYSDTMPPEWR
jgi:hypothetical protein